MSYPNSPEPRILKHFSTCDDPRTRPVQYPLIEIVVMVVLATLCGEEGWEAIADWGRDKLTFLRKFLSFSKGVPSPDTIRRVMERLNPEQFLKGFINWAEEIKGRASGQVCIDGKTLRRAMGDGGPLHIVSAWSEQNRIVLGAVKTNSKSNEITAITDLLNLLILKPGDIVTIDAIGCQKSIVGNIVEQSADYVIALKKNQQNLALEVENFFDQALEAPEYAPCKKCTVVHDKPGRKDTQQVWVCYDLDWLPQRQEWENLQSIVMVYRRWEENGEARQEKRYYISSLHDSTEKLAHIVRRHWSVENELHWHLDVTFQEDASQIGATANENLRVARMTALELLRAETGFKRGLKAKMRRCLRSDCYLGQVLMAGNF